MDWTQRAPLRFQVCLSTMGSLEGYHATSPIFHHPAPPGWCLTPETMEGHSLQQKFPLFYGAEMVKRRRESLSDDCDSPGKVGKMGLFERIVAFIGPLIFTGKSQLGIGMQ